MTTGLIPSLALGLALTGFGGSGWAAPPGLLKTNPAITIRVYDYAEVDRQILREAERTAASVFRKAGVESRWVDSAEAARSAPWNPATKGSFNPSDILLDIIAGVMVERLGLPDGVIGVAPGAEPGRRLAYVFYDRIESLAAREMPRRAHENICESASTAQILGYAMAHEIGHLLLNLKTHSDAGIMRGNWDGKTLQDACYGYLLFTSQQAGAIRAEAHRRLAEPGALAGGSAGGKRLSHQGAGRKAGGSPKGLPHINRAAIVDPEARDASGRPACARALAPAPG